MIRFQYVPATVLLVAALLSGGPLQAQTELAWKFRPGEVLRYRIHYKTETRLKPGSGFSSGLMPRPDLEATLAWTVSKVNADGTAEINLTVEHVREQGRDQSGAGPPWVYDSADPKTLNNPWSMLKRMVYRPVLGATYILTIDRRGDVSKLKLPAGILAGWDEIRVRPQDDRDFLFSVAGLRTLLHLLPRLPEGAIGPNDSWQSRRTESEQGIRATLAETYAPAGREGSRVSFEAKPELSLRFDPAGAPRDDAPGEGEVRIATNVKVENQAGRSRLTFDPAAGRLIGFTRQHHCEVRTTFPTDEPVGGQAGRKFVEVISITDAEVKVEALSLSPSR